MPLIYLSTNKYYLFSKNRIINICKNIKTLQNNSLVEKFYILLLNKYTINIPKIDIRFIKVISNWRLDLYKYERKIVIFKYINIYYYYVNSNGKIINNYTIFKKNKKHCKYFKLEEYPKTSLSSIEFKNFIESTWKENVYNIESTYKHGSPFIKIINLTT